MKTKKIMKENKLDNQRNTHTLLDNLKISGYSSIDDIKRDKQEVYGYLAE